MRDHGLGFAFVEDFQKTARDDDPGVVGPMPVREGLGGAVVDDAETGEPDLLSFETRSMKLRRWFGSRAGLTHSIRYSERRDRSTKKGPKTN